MHGVLPCALLLLCAGFAGEVLAIPPNYPITNVATADYQVADSGLQTSAASTVVTDPSAGNSPPIGAVLDPSNVAENASGVIGTLAAVDLDPGDTHTFAIGDPRFSIVGDVLALVSGTTLDFEATPAVTLIVLVTDAGGGARSVPITITVDDVNEAPADLVLSSVAFSADTPGAAVGELTVTDPDAGDVHAFAVDDARFEVVGTTLELIDTESLPLGTSVALIVTATDSGGLSIQRTFTVTAVPPGGGPPGNSVLRLHLDATGSGAGSPTDVALTQCDAGAGYQDLGVPLRFDGTPLPVPGSIELAPGSLVKSGTAVFIEVEDPDADLDSAAIDLVEIAVTTGSGDSERLRLRETAPDAARFVGYLQTRQTVSAAGDCEVGGAVDLAFAVSYTDALDPTDSATATGVIDPMGRVFHAATGQPVDAASIVLVDAATGLPAAVGAELPGVSFPSEVQSGGTVIDGQGTSIAFPPGGYRFPAVAAGDYRLVITPPNRFVFPSGLADAALQALPGAPYRLGPGARGNVFTVPVGPAFAVDVPLDLAPIVPTPGALTLREFAADGNGAALPVASGQCHDGSAFVAAPPPVHAGQTLAVPGVHPLATAGRFGRGDALFVELADPDQDLDPFAADTVQVSITAGDDRERILLVETGASTGTFTGYLQTGSAAPAAADCVLDAFAGATAEIAYLDPDDVADQAFAYALLDPGFRVFSSGDGAPVDGVSVTLLDAATGLPALGAAFAADGVTEYPTTLTSGASATDAAGNVVTFAPGSFRFPVLRPGTYAFAVTPPAGFAFPSTQDDATLAALPGGPYRLAPGSRGGDFTVTATGDFEFDLALDPFAVEVFVSKQASKDVVSVGDVLQYRVLVQNAAGQAQSAVTVLDRLPKGFRYVAGSTRVNGERGAEPGVGAGGTELAFENVAFDGATAEVRYVVEVTAGAEVGRARNSATAAGPGVSSTNVAFADVTVREDLLQSKAILVGQVHDGACPGAAAEPGAGLGGVRIWLEDGTYVVTDRDGRYHVEGVDPGVHVVQLDEATLPATHELVACERGLRFGGNARSQFVDLAAGSIWRADFYTRPKPPVESELRAQLFSRVRTDAVVQRLVIAGTEVPVRSLTAVVMLPDGMTYRPGTLAIDGTPAADPAGHENGALTVRLPDRDAAFETDLRFSADLAAGVDGVTTKAMVMFETESGGKQKTAVLATDISLAWPESLEERDGERLESVSGSAPGARVFEPSQGELSAKSALARVPLSMPAPVAAPAFVIPAVDDARAPVFDRAWLAAETPGNRLVWPPPDYNPRIPVITIAAKHEQALRAEVLVNGQLVNALNFVGTTVDRGRGVAVSQWDNVPIREGDNTVEVRLATADGASAIVAEADKVLMRTTVHFGDSPIRAELVPGASHLVADGVTVPVLAVRLFDRSGRPARPGLTGEFRVLPPHRLRDPDQRLGAVDSAPEGFDRYLVRRDGIAYVELEPTTQTGEVRLDFEFDEMRKDEIRARLKPGARDWILVGLLDGVVGYNELSGHVETLEDAGLEDEVLTEGRMAFYAKGMIKGQWLLTAAYDTDKETDRELRQQIDPNRFYTLYGDGTQQRYDAESASKLYLKVEREAFATLFGDLDTGFDDTELAKYTRTLNGVQADYFGERIEVSGFASDTELAFVLDELRGDGTSGIYRLTHARVVVNSERVRIVTRDRFRPDEIVAEAGLTRYLDYTIDYDAGTLIFKQPVFSQDENLDNVTIEVEYEVESAQGSDLVAGGRLAYRLDDADSRVGMTYVDDQTSGRRGHLLGADVDWQMLPGTRVRAEIARSDTETGGVGDAYLLELEQRSGELAGRVFYREQEAEFGFGQQSVQVSDAREYGLEGEYRLGERMRLEAEVFQQDDLSSNGSRTVADSQVEYMLGDARVTTGLRAVREQSADGTNRDSDLLTLGVSQGILEERLRLRGNAEIGIGGAESPDYPNRLIAGADYAISDSVDLVLEQEFTFGDLRDTQDTRAGVKVRPWNGADVSAALGRQMGENGERIFATTGLLQQWRLDDRWSVDFGADRVQTLEREAQADDPDAVLPNPDVPPASGSIGDDFTAFFTGFAYRGDDWNANARLELHQGDLSDKWNLLFGASRELTNGKVTSGSLSALAEELADGSTRDRTEARWGFAWRPFDSPWTLLNRLDLAFDTFEDGVFDTRTRKLVNNSHLNFKSAAGGQLSLQLGLKYLVETIDGDAYDSVTALYGTEYRRGFAERWDWGVQAGALHSMNANLFRYTAGLSIGRSFLDNAWVSVGYNFLGFEDADFAAAEYTARGPYLELRMRFDQDHLERFLGFVGREGR